MVLSIYKWDQQWLRRAQYPNKYGLPGWALSSACCCTCWTWKDGFNRTASTDIGSGWNEVSGNWEIVNSGYGDANPDNEPAPLNQLHEEYGTSIGAGGTSGAKIIGTTPEPFDSAGQQSIYVNVQEPAVGDVYWIYPCCTDTNTTGPVSVKFTYNGDFEWLIEFGSISKTVNGTKFNTGMVDSHVFFTLWVCADHASGQTKANVIGYTDPAWDDSADPGAGRYYGLGHGNASTGAVFDDFSISELRNELESCSECWCNCQGNAVTRHLYAEIHNAINRAACIDGVGWDMTFLDGPGDPTPHHWLGTANFPRWDTGTQDVLWHLACDSSGDDNPDWPGENFHLSTGAWDGGCTLMIRDTLAPGAPDLIMTADPDLSSCDPLELWFGPYPMAKGDLVCNVCQQPASGSDDTGEFWIVITEK